MYDLVLDLHPMSGPAELADEHRRQFELAFHAISYMHRTDRPHTRHYPQHWLDLAAHWLRRYYPQQELWLRPFLAASLARGDVAYTPIDQIGYVSLGFSEGTTAGSSGRWREVLDTRRLLAPTVIHRPRTGPAISLDVTREIGANYVGLVGRQEW